MKKSSVKVFLGAVVAVAIGLTTITTIPVASRDQQNVRLSMLGEANAFCEYNGIPYAECHWLPFHHCEIALPNGAIAICGSHKLDS
jgi:hypothetical protein